MKKMVQKNYTEEEIDTIIKFILNESVDESLRKEVYHNVFVLNEFEHTPDWEGDWERTKARLQRFKDRFGKAADVTKRFFKGWGEYIDKAKAKKEGRPYEPATPVKPPEPAASTPAKPDEKPATSDKPSAPSKPAEKPPETLKQKVEKRKSDLEAARKRAEERKAVWKKDPTVKPSEKPAETPVPVKPTEPVKPKEEPKPVVPPVTPPVTKKETPTPAGDAARAPEPVPATPKPVEPTTTPTWGGVTAKFDRTTDLLKQASAKLDKLKR